MTRFSSNHWRATAKAVPGPKRRFTVDFPSLPLRKKHKNKRPSKEPKFPHDGTVRAVASAAAKARRKSEYVLRFDKVVKTYCGMVVGFTDRFSVEEYLYLKLKRMVADHEERRVPLGRKGLEAQAETIFHEIEASILSMASNGRPIKQGKRHDRHRVWARIHERGCKCFLTLLSQKKDGKWFVLSFETKGKFRRRMRSRSSRKDLKYRNTPKHKRYQPLLKPLAAQLRKRGFFHTVGGREVVE
ncbi:MAG: hypothetical protein AAB386_03515 [Patescibacteria group bacterium]